MSLAGLIAGAAASMAGAVSSAMKNNSNKSSSSSGSSSNKTSSSSSGSGSSSRGHTTSSDGYTSLGTWHDQGIKETNPSDYNQIQQYKQQYEDAQARGDTAAMNAAHEAAESIRRQYGYIGGTDGSKYISIGNSLPEGTGAEIVMGGGGGSGSLGSQMDYAGMLQSGFDQYRDYMEQAAAQQRAELQAKVDAAVAQLNSQREGVGKQTALNNAAAERAYMQTISPNGSLAENLAANGLLTSGATESSQIAAGNTYQNALNENARTEAEVIAELEQAITQAQLTGDIEAANAYADILTQIAQMGYQNVQDIIAAGQWQQQFDYNQGVTDAGLTGYYNGMPTLESQRLELERQQFEQQKLQIQQQLQLGEIDQQTAEKNLEYLDAQIQQLNQQIQYNAQQLAAS